MNQLKMGDVISKRRRKLGLTQNELAKSLNISFQAISKWENDAAYPDVTLLPKLAAALGTTIDALMGYSGVTTDYDRRYDAEEYYWGVTPNEICYDILKILPPVKPYRILDIGCGEGKDAVFFARCGYEVAAFDNSKHGISKAKKLAEHNHVQVDFFVADIQDYFPNTEYDIIFCSGALHFISQAERKEMCERLKEHTAVNGINALNLFVKKPFIADAPDSTAEEEKNTWCWGYSGELFGYYQDWLFHCCSEDIFDCTSGGIPHQHCMDTLIAQRMVGD